MDHTGQHTLIPYIEQYLTARRRRGELAATSVNNMRGHLYRLATSHGHRPLSALTRPAIDRWLETIGDRAPATRRTNLSTLTGFCRWLHHQHLIPTDPTLNLPRIRQPRLEPRALPTTDITRLLTTGCPDNRARAIVMLAVGMGLRCCEIAQADTGDYDERAAVLLVVGKGGHQRLLPVPSATSAALAAYWATEGRKGGPLIRNRTNGGPLAPKTISGYVRAWMRTCGVKRAAWDGRGAHALRHTAASDVLDRTTEGNAILIVQAMLGHARLETTVRYLRRVALPDLRRAMEGREYGPGLADAS